MTSLCSLLTLCCSRLSGGSEKIVQEKKQTHLLTACPDKTIVGIVERCALFVLLLPFLRLEV
jgi:hypothetical protein